MSRRLSRLAAAASLAAHITIGTAMAQSTSNPASQPDSSKTNTAATTSSSARTPAWPHPFAARSGDGKANREVWLMSLGKVETLLADSTYDPASDTLTPIAGAKPEAAGSTLTQPVAHYFRDKLGYKYFTPMDKSVFPLPPSGWCTWYYFYGSATQEEVVSNAKWISENLKPFGASVVQVDDSWQGTRVHGRDWTNLDPKFSRGLADLAKNIKALGLVPGLWLAPHGQSNPEVVNANPKVFLQHPDGTTVARSWTGEYLLDPSAPEAQPYLKALFEKLNADGFEYYKIDGQSVAWEEYNKPNVAAAMQRKGDVGEFYRDTLKSIRGAIGKNRYLLGCWTAPYEGFGIMDGGRTADDIVMGWSGFKIALDTTIKNYLMHNIAWYCDPDVMEVRAPLTQDQARAWATLQGLTGQALMSTDRLTDLSDDRVEIMRRVYPAADIRPMDLFKPDRNKRIWDLKINDGARNYDVVGVFNWDVEKLDRRLLKWSDIGLDNSKEYHVYDFWNKEYLGRHRAGMMIEVPPTGVRVLSIVENKLELGDGTDNGAPKGTEKLQLISTSRHMTQGWTDEVMMKADDKGGASGTSVVVKGDPYELRFALPIGRAITVANMWQGKGDVFRAKPVIENHQGWAAVRVTSGYGDLLRWQIETGPAPVFNYAPQRPEKGLVVAPVAGDDDGDKGAMDVTWADQYYLSSGYQVYVDDKLVGFTPKNFFPLRGLEPGSKHTVAIETVWETGAVSRNYLELPFTAGAAAKSEP